MNSDCFSEVVSSFDIYKNSFAAFGQTTEEKSPLKILNFNNFIHRISKHRCLGGFSKIKTVVVDKKKFNKPLIVDEKQKKIVVSQKTSQDKLLRFLKKNNYKKTNKINVFGDYAVRGGLIDVFLYNAGKPCRFSFLEDNVKVYVFDLSSGEIIKNKTNMVVGSDIKSKPTKTIKSLIKEEDLVVEYSREKTTIINKTKNKTGAIKASLVSLGLYNKTKNNFTYSEKLSSCGIRVGDSIGVVPVWFKNKKNTASDLDPAGDFLNVGDYYIHDNFGVCRLVGVDNRVGDFVLSVFLEFADGRIRLSATRLHLLSFLDVSGEQIKLDCIGSSSTWRRRKQNYSKKAQEYALDLIKTYKKRSALRRPPCVLDKELQSLFASTFEHKETIDQAQCEKQITNDLCSSFPMNRLLCGDVGFGKTEVALRSVFLALYNNKKVVVLVPTTILANQIYDCFAKRLRPFGYDPLLFLGGNKKNNPSRGVGSFLYIGTHALLYDEEVLSFVDFLVVDEEHRFGIKDKEKIIHTNPLCDVLFMSATPLPKTLQFAISKIKTISTINSPPLSKKPIITDVVFYDKASFLTPIKNEMSRGGLVYVVENSVYNVKKTHRYLCSVLPAGSCKMIYGSLGKNKTNSIMDSFRAASFSVLISTSIIESGVDIGGVNTIIINNSHCFGLSQLYQLRGRVGRSGKQAFAFFTIPKGLFLSDSVLKRLETLKKHVVLGSGCAVALCDLKQRGPGFLLGYKQSGKVPVGFEYYSKLVSSFLLKRDRGVSGCFLPEVFFKGSFLPVSFFSSAQDCLLYYKLFSDCFSLSGVLSLEKKLFSLFGVFPVEVVGFIKDRKLSVGIKKSIIYKVVSDDVFVFIFLGCSLGVFDGVFQKRVGAFFNSKKISFDVFQHKKNIKIQYKKTKKDDYILIQSLGKLLYEN